MEKAILRYIVGFVLLLTGLGKMLDLPGFMQVLATYKLVPSPVLSAVAVAMVLMELRIAELLLRGISVRTAASASVVLHVIFIVVLVRTIAAGLEIPNCGCFGVFLARPLTWQTVVEDTVMLAVSLRLFFVAGRAS